MLERVDNLIGRMTVLEDQNSWGFGFLESVRKQLAEGRTLSPRQIEVLEETESRYSDEALKSRAEFKENFTEDMEAKFAIALQYYRKTGYYSNVTYKYLTASGERQNGAPTQKEYNKLVLNKYAAGVIRNLQSEPKFPVGSTAAFRANLYGNLGNKPVIILKYGNAEEVRSHAKGAKPVQVLPIGSSDPIWTEERCLKKAKAQKRKSDKR